MFCGICGAFGDGTSPKTLDAMIEISLGVIRPTQVQIGATVLVLTTGTFTTDFCYDSYDIFSTKNRKSEGLMRPRAETEKN